MNNWEFYDWKKGLAGRQGQVLYKSSFVCAFCRGKGLVGPNQKAKCQVCGGRGENQVEPPVTVCAYCRGRGMKKPNSFIVCIVCKGKGVVAIEEPAARCKSCRGGGTAQSGLPCLSCGGKGSVNIE